MKLRMDEKMKYALLRESHENQSVWTRSVSCFPSDFKKGQCFTSNEQLYFRNEKRLWFVTLIAGTCMLYSTRTTMPLLVPAVAAEQKWSKTDSGTVLSSFFWGYTLTQVGFL